MIGTERERIELEGLRWINARAIGRLPDFLIIGAQKSGTTTLHNHLKRHPELGAPTPKELRFFDREYLNGPAWYQQKFAGLAARVCFESSPSYLFQADTPRRVRSALPQARFIVILRNPVERTHSHYWHMVRQGRETLSFMDALDREVERTQRGRDAVMARAKVYDEPYQWFSYQAGSHYAELLSRWFSEFPRERFLILDFHELIASPQAVVDQTTDFLGVARLNVDTKLWSNAHPHPGIEPSMHQRLHKHFEPKNADLAALLGTSLSWA